MMEDDYKKFCMKCNWNDSDFGCSCPSGEEVYQCDMYMHYHPDEVKEFEKSMEEWVSETKDKLDSYIIAEAKMIKKESYKYDLDISKYRVNWKKLIEILDKERKEEGAD